MNNDFIWSDVVKMINLNKTNPIIPKKGVCDPHIHIFNNKAYLYASHDLSAQNDYWIMQDWQIWSSEDLVHWTYETTIKPEDTYIGKYDKCWATDAAYKNGKYYFYFSKGNLETGVLVSDAPAKDFIDVISKPVLEKDLTPTRQYDPTVFIDDENTPYIIFGNHVGNGYFIARLNDDMLSLAETPKNIMIDNGYARDDKSFLHKHNEIYYLSWASHYAVSDNIYGPYKYMGNIGASNDHGSFFEWKNQWFNAFTIFDPSYYYRSTGICYIHYRVNGEMVADQTIVENGVGQYNANWNKIEAEWYMESHNAIKKENSNKGFDVCPYENEAYLFFPNIYNLEENTGICFFAENHSNEDAFIEIRQNTPKGKLLGKCIINSTGNDDYQIYKTFICRLENTEGTKNIYFVFKGNTINSISLDWFKFFR